MPRLLPDVLTDEDFPVEFGRYTLQGLLGEGGMARVFRAELQGPEGFRKPTAIKIVRSSVASDNERLRTSLINEARLGGLLHHPNVVDTYDFGEQDGLPYIAMEYIRGIGLEKVLFLVDPLPPAIAAEIAIQICAGLDHAHNLEDVEGDSELVHRDLKPSNVILSRDGLVKVMDFGIAKAEALSSTNTATGMTKGTPSYMSPEQVNGDDLNRRSDLFALGAIIYELFTGERLFQADSLMSILMSVIQVEERLAASGALDQLDLIALGLSDIVSGCLRRRPEDRYADAATIEQDLKLLARTLPPPPSLKLWARELMAGQGMGVGEDSISTVPPIRAAPTTLRTGPRRTVGASPPPTRATDRGFVAPTVPTAPAVAAPTTQPTAPAVEAASPAPPGQPGVAPASSQVPATRLQPVPQPPPPTPAQTPTQGDGGGTLWVDEEDGLQKRRRKKKKKGAPLLLLLIGLLAGGAMAIVAVVGVLLVMRSTEPDEVVEVTPDTHEFGDLSMAPEPTPARPTPTRTRRPTTPRPVEAAAVIAADTPEQTPEATPEPTPELVVVDPVVVSPATVTPTPRPTARPTRAPEPTPQATPASAQSERDRLSEERRRALLGDRATPRPKEETYSGPPALAQPRVVRLDEDDEGVRVRFQVQIKGSCTDPSLTLKYNPPGASWLTAPMRVKDGGRAMVNLTFAPKNQGKVVYKIEGACAGGESLASGTVKHVVE